jgi:NADPH:quinone reductase-like Zn-dependent oxidoreductase
MPRSYVFTQYGGPEVQQFMEVARPVPAEGQLLVAVRVAAVNPADWKRRRGAGQASPLSEPTGLGREVAGVVEAVGPGTEGFAIGDDVLGVPPVGGGFADYAILSVDQAAHKPASVSFADASTLGVAAATAFDGLNQLAVGAGDTLLIIGVGGGVGVAAAQMAIARGARVIGTASEAKRSFVESLGVTHVTYGDGCVDRIRAVAPDGVDALYDMVGGDALREVAGLVKGGSRLTSAADSPTAVEVGGAAQSRTRNSATLEACAQLVESGALKPFVTEVFPLDKVGEALALVESGHATGKVVIEVS